MLEAGGWRLELESARPRIAFQWVQPDGGNN